MDKPRIIIADMDYSYVIPLQLKFAEEFFGRIDLEIITEQKYFEELFTMPQKIDILIVTEGLYDSSLKKHNIGKIFVMTEQNEEGETADLTVTTLFKYTSIKEIFNEITSKSAEILNIESEGKKEPQIVLVYSASGGVGKTTVSFGISSCLAKNYKKVLYINADRMQSFQYLLEDSSPISSSEVYANLVRADKRIYSEIRHVIRKEGFHYLPPFKASLLSLGLAYTIYEKIALSAKNSGEYDFVVIDADSVFDEEKARLMEIAEHVIIVTNQTAKAVYATNTLVSNVNGIGTDKYIFICNDFDRNKDNALIASDFQIKFTVNDYIEHFEHYDRMRVRDFGDDRGIRKATFLFV